MSAPRDNLVREMPFEVTRTEEDGDGLTFEGYAAVWDSPTEINSRAEGNFIERIKPGAFNRTLNAKKPVFMFNHGQHPLIGDMPLGTIQEAREDAHGLFIQARLSDNWLVQPVRDAIAEGSISGMSFRMSIPDGGDTWRRAKGDQLAERDIHEIKCYELGPVVFPAYEATSANVRSDDLADLARALFRADTQPYGDTNYADPGYKADNVKRYPINTAAHVKAAWAYINMPKNQQGYTSAQVASIKDRIEAAAKKFGITIADEPDADADDAMKSAEPGGEMRDLFDQIEAAVQDVHPGLSLSNFDEDRADCVDADGELVEVTFSRDDDGNVTVAEPAPADEATPEATPDPTDEVTPRGDPQEQRILRLLQAKQLGVEIQHGTH